jgi:uncharacterized protein YdbL (DUF1318 family)
MKAILFILPFLFGNASFADDLEVRLTKARTDKAVSEQPTGYLRAATSDAAIKALVEEVNKKRKEKYKEVASKTEGAKLETVEQAAGKQLMEKYK